MRTHTKQWQIYYIMLEKVCTIMGTYVVQLKKKIVELRHWPLLGEIPYFTNYLRVLKPFWTIFFWVLVLKYKKFFQNHFFAVLHHFETASTSIENGHKFANWQRELTKSTFIIKFITISSYKASTFRFDLFIHFLNIYN